MHNTTKSFYVESRGSTCDAVVSSTCVRVFVVAQASQGSKILSLDASAASQFWQQEVNETA